MKRPMINIIDRARQLEQAVADLRNHAKRFYYEVMLLGHRCPACRSEMVMMKEGLCGCTRCPHQCDPTLTFQRCLACGGTPHLKVSRYRCSDCDGDIPSRFLFDGIVYDRDYFRIKMAESRMRSQEQQAERHEVSVMHTVPRSNATIPPPIDLESVPGLTEALDGLSASARAEATMWLELARDMGANGFDLSRYETHLQAHIGPIEVCFDDIPALNADRPRLDRIWRFIAMIFLAHGGYLAMYQEDQEIWVKSKNETHREGPTIPRHAA